jgi:type IV secretion system protein VirB10
VSLQQPGVGPIARQRTHLSGRQKIGIFIILAVVGAAFVILARVFTGSAKHETTPPNDFAASAGIPYSPPLRPEVAKPVIMSFPPPPVVAAKPIAAAATPAPPTKDPDADSAIFADQGVGGYETRTAVSGTSGNDGGAKDNLSAALVHSDLGATAHATIMKHPSLTIPAGTVIPCILQTAINSQLAGFVDCTIPSEVRGATGTVTLLDRGSQVFGEIKSGLREGQSRLFILWIRARTPENVVVTFDSPAADELGRAGVGGYVNDHFWSRFGAALLYSLIDYGPQLAVASLQRNNGNFGTSNYVQFVQPQQQLANTILQDKLNIPPTLEKNQGETVSIFVARDVDFSGVYDLEATAP